MSQFFVGPKWGNLKPLATPLIVTLLMWFRISHRRLMELLEKI